MDGLLAAITATLSSSTDALLQSSLRSWFLFVEYLPVGLSGERRLPHLLQRSDEMK